MNIHNLAKSLGIDSKTTKHYINILASVGLVRIMRPYEGGSSGIRKPSKMFLNNTNLIHTLQQYLGLQHSKGMERELFFIQSLQNAEIEIFYSKEGVAKLLCPEKTMILGQVSSGSFSCHDPLEEVDPEGSAEESGQKLPKKGIFTGQMSFAIPSKEADFRTRKAIFEIGGKNKTKDQLKGLKEPSYLVKDDILQPLKGEIPLFLFGFVY